ncbi:hypothetical protein Harman_11720 [Haloarcula mannanilytica]|uniref:Uncharacterized protein n=1 Tax=Haloarcula mannanilytica TaxID=2509225 RepID=A0A4C2EHM8_9EURY|nr:hypothetical protein [Haloarcula mannanilytica]GCF13237.1 hypothetical protein Harman_11720 [Haloarcula mannanilytica]
MTGNLPLRAILVTVTVLLAGCSGIGLSGQQSPEAATQTQVPTEAQTLTIPNESGLEPSNTTVEFKGDITETPENSPVDAGTVEQEIKRMGHADEVKVREKRYGYAVLVYRNTTDMSELGRTMKATYEAIYRLHTAGDVGEVKVTHTWEAAPPRQQTINQTMLTKFESGEWDTAEFEAQIGLTSEPVNESEWDE